jgi:uncharacterized protein YlxW (UPF0749 family)
MKLFRRIKRSARILPEHNLEKFWALEARLVPFFGKAPYYRGKSFLRGCMAEDVASNLLATVQSLRAERERLRAENLRLRQELGQNQTQLRELEYRLMQAEYDLASERGK